MKIAIVIHAFYLEQLKVILGKIQMILSKNYYHTIDVYITLPFIKKSLQSIIDSYSFPVNIHWCENKGMDLLPFFELIPNLQHYDWVLKLHTKNNNNELNELWFKTLIDELVGSPDIFKKTIEILEQNQDWKMAGILPFFLSAHKLMLKNRKNIDKLAKLWGLNTDKDWGFFAGSFYWVKPQALNSYAQTLLKQKDWFDNEFAKDGLFAHAVERLISLAVGQVGLFYGYAELCIDSQHKFAINQAFFYQLLENIQDLDKIICILTEVYPLNVKKYEQTCGILFSSDKIALKHYVLVGQFGDCTHLILPITLQRKQEKLFSWDKLKNKQRIKGLVSIVIPVLNEIKLTLACLKSIKKYTKYANIEVIVVDNGSDFLTSQALNLYAMTDKRCKIIRLDENLNFAVGCNYGFSQSSGEYVLFLNNDTLATKYWLTPLIEAIKNQKIVAVQPLLLYPNSTVQCAGVEFGDDGFGFSKYEGKSSQDSVVLKSQSCAALTGACLLLRADDFVGIKGFNTWFINGQEDMDLCLRLSYLHPNQRFFYCADSIIFHYESSTVGRKHNITKNRQIFQIFWHSPYFKNKVNTMSVYSILSLANTAMRNGWYKLAENLYFLAIVDNKDIKFMVDFNLSFLSRLSKDRGDSIFKKTSRFKVSSELESLKLSLVLSQKNLYANNMDCLNGLLLAKNNDPFFYVDPNIVLDEGFYAISFCLVLNASFCNQFFKLYIDYGFGFSEDSVVSLLCKHGFNERIFYLKGTPKALRIDPLECKGEFALFNFEIASLHRYNTEQYLLNFSLKNRLPLLENYNSANLYQNYNNVIRTYNAKFSYNDWIELFENSNLNCEPSENIENKDRDKIFFSIVVSCQFGDYGNLAVTLQSILKQSYLGCELFVVGSDFDVGMSTMKVAENNKIPLCFIDVGLFDGWISATNHAIEIAGGEYIGFLEVGDLMANNALYYFKKDITSSNYKPTIIYSDHDYIDDDGNRSNPCFKSDWNPDLLYSRNYIFKLCFINLESARLINGMRFDGALGGEWDLMLRLLNFNKNAHVCHIDKVLYHRRSSNELLTKSFDVKQTENSIQILRHYLQDKGVFGAEIERGLVKGAYRIHWPIPNPEPKVSLIIPTRDGLEIVERAVRSILEKTTYTNYEILIVDNGSVRSDTLEFFKVIQSEDKRVRVVSYNFPFNYSAINNFGFQYTDGSIIGLINNDVEVINPGWLSEMVSHVVRPEVGCVGAKLYFPNNQLQHGGVILGVGGVANHIYKFAHKTDTGYFDNLMVVQNYSAVTAACLLVRREIYREVGGLDEGNFKVAYNDVDFCLKVMSLGYRNVWTPYAELYHYESISRGSDVADVKKFDRLMTESEFLKHKWYNLISKDPYYSNNFDKNDLYCSLSSRLTRDLSFDNSILFDWEKEQSGHRNVCVFVNYDKNSQLHEYVLFYLQSLAKYFDVVFVSTSEKLHFNQSSMDALKGVCSKIVVRKNEGYDFGSWRLGIELIRNYIAGYDNLLLCNDSVYGPFMDLGLLINYFDNSDLDVMGLIKSREVREHLQSYFVLYKRNVFLSEEFHEFWSNIKIHSDKWDIILNYEIGWSQRLMRVFSDKFAIGAYCYTDDMPAVNVSHVYWKELLVNRGFPFIKIELLRDNPFKIHDVDNWKAEVEKISNYDTTMIDEHLREFGKF